MRKDPKKTLPFATVLSYYGRSGPMSTLEVCVVNRERRPAAHAMQKVLDFLTALAANNNREWFADHKGEYLEVKDRIEHLTEELLRKVSEFDPEALHLRPSDCLYRIYRDTRFSSDKTPYKTHIGIYISPPYGKKSILAGYYLHIEPGNCLVGGGAWMPEAPVLKRIRTDIFENVEEYLEIIENTGFRKFYPVVGEDLLKTAPKGFPKDWEHVNLLRPRSYTVLAPLSDRRIISPELVGTVAEMMKAMKPFNDFLNYAINPSE